jgi:GGDEF domain-containing protein
MEASREERDADVTQTPLPSQTGFGSTTVKIALLMLIIEIFIMLGFDWLGMQLTDWKLALLDAVLLASIGAPIAYFAFVRPRDQQIRAGILALDQARLDAENLARFDALTGVLNRRALLEALDQEVERTKRYGRDLVCLMLDLDHFKTLNDTYGHQFGD